MYKPFKRLFAILLTLIMLMSLVPTVFADGRVVSSGRANLARVYTEAENAIIERDVFAKIAEVEQAAAQPMGGLSSLTEADYIGMLPQVIKAIENSDTYEPGTLQQNGSFLVWQTTTGIPCCFDPRMEAELHNTTNDPSEEEIAAAEADAEP